MSGVPFDPSRRRVSEDRLRKNEQTRQMQADYESGMTFAQVGEKYGLSEDAARQRIRRRSPYRPIISLGVR